MLIEKWEIRKAIIEDADFFIASFFQIYGIHLAKHSFLGLFKKKLKSQTCLIYVAENALGNTIGCIVCEKQETFQNLQSILQIKEFYVSPKYRKFNLADDLYSFVEGKAMKMCISKIEVMCNLTATTTQNFYLRKKFITDRKSYIKLI
jgi:ribosomal protein S18 acetylase RimI-like enzyme